MTHLRTSISLDREIVAAIDEIRGRVSRSAFIEDTLTKLYGLDVPERAPLTVPRRNQGPHSEETKEKLTIVGR